MSLKKSNIISWTDDQETFTFLWRSWDVRAAKRILTKKPRKIEKVSVTQLKEFLSSVSNNEDGSLSLKMGIYTEEDRVKNDSTIDLNIPLIAIITNGKNALPIDGWHRVARAVLLGVTELPIVFLTLRESASIEC